MVETNTVLALLLLYKYIALSMLVLFEGFFSIIAAGYLVSINEMQLRTVLIVVILTDLASDIIFYVFGAKISKTKIGKRLGLTDKNVTSIGKLYDSYGPAILVIAKLSSYLAPAAITVAGIARMNIPKFLLFCTIGSLPKNIALIGSGYFLGASFNMAERNAKYTFVSITMISIFVVLVIFIRYKMKTKN